MKTYNSFSEIKSDLGSGSTTCVALVNSYIQNILANKNLNVFLEVFEKSALEKAKLVDEKMDWVVARMKIIGKLQVDCP